LTSGRARGFVVLAVALPLAACHANGWVEMRHDPLENHPLHAAASGLIDPDWRQEDAAAIIARAQCGAPETQYQAGHILDRGLGQPPDAVGAHAWYAIAASRGFAPAATERDRLGAHLTSEELAEASRIAAAWPPGACAAEAGG
jgi:TPR repeat protein